jgi:NifU-like protein involved in Fe-S cluster formation
MIIKIKDIKLHPHPPLHLPSSPVKIHCSLLAEEAIHAAVKDYQEKRGGVEADVGEA